MNPLVYHIVSGQSFFTGIGLLIIAAVASGRTESAYGRVTVFAFLVGVIAVVTSSTAIPYWYYGATAAVTLFWIAAYFRKSWRRWARNGFIAVWVLAAAIEIPYHQMPTLSPAPDRTVTIIGDSVTAGVGGDETSETWPTILAREHELQVQDISHMGETAASALTRLKSNAITSSVIVVEIGGNDVLGSTTSAQFARDMDALLLHLSTPERQVVMFELPLPPFFHEFGRVQRSVAAKYDVKLVPKRVFLSVIAGTHSTMDSIHLSQSGHQFMANTVWNLLQPAFR